MMSEEATDLMLASMAAEITNLKQELAVALRVPCPTCGGDTGYYNNANDWIGCEECNVANDGLNPGTIDTRLAAVLEACAMVRMVREEWPMHCEVRATDLEAWARERWG